MEHSFKVGDRVRLVNSASLENNPNLIGVDGIITSITGDDPPDYKLAYLDFNVKGMVIKKSFYLFKLSPAFCEITGKLSICGDI